jgi:hypothetical protein
MSRTRALTACSTSTGETRWKRPVTDTCVMFWSSEPSVSVAAIPSAPSASAPTPSFASSFALTRGFCSLLTRRLPFLFWLPTKIMFRASRG